MQACVFLKIGKVQILVNELLERSLTQSANFKDGNVTFSCCVPRGKARMELLFDKNAYASGETCNLKILVDNRYIFA